MVSDNEDLVVGPVQLLVLGFDEPGSTDAIRSEIARLREHDVIRLLDLLVIRKDADGEVERILRSDLTQEEAMELGALAGALVGFGADGEDGGAVGAVLGAAALEDGHVFNEDDVWYVDDVIPPNSAAVIALIEHRWAIALRNAVRDAGGFQVADAWIHPRDLVAVGMAAAEQAQVG